MHPQFFLIRLVSSHIETWRENSSATGGSLRLCTRLGLHSDWLRGLYLIVPAEKIMHFNFLFVLKHNNNLQFIWRSRVDRNLLNSQESAQRTRHPIFFFSCDVYSSWCRQSQLDFKKDWFLSNQSWEFCSKSAPLSFWIYSDFRARKLFYLISNK